LFRGDSNVQKSLVALDPARPLPRHPGIYSALHRFDQRPGADPSGAAIPNVTVTVTDVSRRFNFTAVSDAAGNFVVRNLPPSTYNIRAEAADVTAFTRDNVVLNVNQNLTLPVGLTVAGEAQTVTVIEGAPLVLAQDAITGQTINRTFINACR
jgi:hypothetical protein